jgi:PTS system mannose-specific IID component
MSRVLTKKDLRNAGWRFISRGIGTYSYTMQMAPTIVYSIVPCLRKIYPDDDEFIEAVNNHYKYFNAHPWLAHLLIGATLAIEDTEGIKAKDAVQDLKVSLMGPISGIGDTIGWVLIPTIFGSISGYMALEGNPAGLIIWVLLNLFFLVFRIRFFEYGYDYGTKLITGFRKQLNTFTEAASVLGIVVVGALVASVITIRTPLAFQSGDVTIAIQPLIDQVMPSLLSVVLVGVIYWLMSVKKLKMTTIILGVLVFSMVCAAFGILG